MPSSGRTGVVCFGRRDVEMSPVSSPFNPCTASVGGGNPNMKKTNPLKLPRAHFSAEHHQDRDSVSFSRAIKTQPGKGMTFHNVSGRP